MLELIKQHTHVDEPSVWTEMREDIFLIVLGDSRVAELDLREVKNEGKR